MIILLKLLIGLTITLIVIWLTTLDVGENKRKLINLFSFALIFGGLIGLGFIPGNDYKDGTYCAEIHYYNPETETESKYFLPVFVKDGKLVKLQWSNSGWLDESHFKAPNVSDGTATFTSDKGYEYEIELLNSNSKCK
ncbi:hypothetical protein QFZ37_003790 [Chryseobacterium ginsenosidimutans]|uniref:hypothetical protein n=1 Tax=Chryseobacterium ginsenosidimutans TaxID=687846 RepID=UPI00277F8360|nr:hypothetical protein [Chryseobacterium ginsenosidimutans]MDQ0595421.1 hypothetical protein [Chryseobacterium ginsenosidimutans]